MTKKVVIADIIVFILVSIRATYSAALVDAGSIVYDNPWDDGGHAMTMKEAVLYNIPLGLSEGFVVAGIALLAYFVGRAIYKEIKR